MCPGLVEVGQVYIRCDNIEKENIILFTCLSMCVCVVVVDAHALVCVKQTDLAAPKKGNRSAATSCSAILVQGVGMEVRVATISTTIFASGVSS